MTAITFERPRRDLALVVGGVLLLAFGYELYFTVASPFGVIYHVGADYSIYMGGARRFLAGGTFYQPFDTWYPPIALLLLVPFSFLPAVLWWAVPFGVMGYVIARQCRTDWQRVALIAALANFALVVLASGNGSLWIWTFVVAGNRWGWPAAFVLLKPSLAPFALVGVRSRSWWIAVALLAVVSLLMLPLWFDYFRALASWGGGGRYALGSLPEWLTIGLLWFATRKGDRNALA